MNNLQSLLVAWRKCRYLRFSSDLPKEYVSDLDSAYSHLTNILLDCLDTDELFSCLSSISKK